MRRAVRFGKLSLAKIAYVVFKYGLDLVLKFPVYSQHDGVSRVLLYQHILDDRSVVTDGYPFFTLCAAKLGFHRLFYSALAHRVADVIALRLELLILLGVYGSHIAYAVGKNVARGIYPYCVLGDVYSGHGGLQLMDFRGGGYRNVLDEGVVCRGGKVSEEHLVPHARYHPLFVIGVPV